MTMPIVTPRLPGHALDDDHMAPWLLALSCWLLVGGAALILVPGLRGFDPLLGWLPFWLVVAPALDLAMLRRRRLMAGTLDLLARIDRRRRKSRQAKPLARRSRSVRRARPSARAARA